MNRSEKEVKARYESQGWRMLRGGAPDFIAIKDENGRGAIKEFRGIEVKSPGGNLSHQQGVYRKIFELAGIPFIVEVSDGKKPIPNIGVQTMPPRPLQQKWPKVKTDDLTTVYEAARQLKTSRMTIYRWIKAEKLIAIKLNHTTFIPKSEVERLKVYRAE